MHLTHLAIDPHSNRDHNRRTTEEEINIKEILRVIHENDHKLQHGSLKGASKALPYSN